MKFSTKTSILAAAVAMAFGAAPATAGTMVTFQCPGQSDVDTDPATVVDCTVPAFPGGNTIEDLNVSLGIQNGWIGDLEIILSHDGVNVTLYSNSNDTFGSMNAEFDDAAAGPPPLTGSVLGTFQPQGPGTLADFNGLGFAGLWQLSILDQTIPGDGDDLVSFNLTAQVPEPSTLALLGLGFAGAGAALRRRKKTKTDR